MLVEFQRLLLGTLGGVGHIAFPWLLHAIDIAGESTADEDFAEEAAAFGILQSVDGENLSALHIGKAKNGFDVVKALLELALVEQDGNIGVVDDGFLDDGAADYVLQLLGDDTDHGPELSGGLVEVLDVLGHHRRGYGLPGFFNDQHLAVLLDAHLLDEHVHDDERHQRE